MHSVQVGMWDPRAPSKHDSPLASPPPSDVRLAHGTTDCPAKRITFYKSGDSQFGGVRMAVHRRSFKCFDALLDDLSQKVPLPFGVRTVTTPRGTNTIQHLEQLQDGGCYLCSDRRQAKPINMELASKRPSIWSHHNRRPQRPESSSTTPPNHLPYRQRRILLVKNSEPGTRRSVVLSRRSTRSLGAFLDEVSEVMQFHVRKLYTAEGRKIDNVQSLMTCPPVLVCVGREAFSPVLANFIKKNSEEKLPGLDSRSPGLGPRTPGNGVRSPAVQGARSPPHGAQSRASEYSEGHESKKNVNFGLETKKSIIHPRSDSSNRSNHFSMSSEKSYGNGVSSYSQARPAIMNDDIEKRVLVNKDGSLSVEMRVRFRLHNDETVHWSTQIKKSPSLTNDCCPLSQVQPHYLNNGQSESCSDPDSMSFDPEVVDYSSQPVQHALEANHCPCCYQRPEQHYDLWENPAHTRKQPLVPPPHPLTSSHTRRRHTNSSSSSSSCNSRRVVHRRAQLSSCGGGSGSEQSQLIQQEMCVTEQVEHTVEVEQDGDNHIEVCRVSRCHSRSEVVTRDSNHRPLSSKSGEEEVMIEEEQERPQSAVSCSSNVLQSLEEDQDEEEEDLPPSASRCHHSDEPSPSPSSKISTVKKHKGGEERASSAVSAASSCCCGSVTQLPTAEAEEMDRAPSSKSKVSRASCRSGRTGLSTSSKKSGASTVCPDCGGCKQGATSNPGSPQHKKENGSSDSNDDTSEDSAGSTQSNKSNLTNCGRNSAESNVLECRASSAVSRASSPEVKEEERATSAISAASHTSNRSHRSGRNGATGVIVDKEEGRSLSNMSARSRKSKTPDARTTKEAEAENDGERAISSLSVKSGVSAKTGTSVKSHKSNCPLKSNAASPTDNTAVEEEVTRKKSPSSLSERPHSALSAKSNVTAKSNASHRSACSRCAQVKSPGAEEATREEEGTDGQNRTASAMSVKSNLSVKSNNSHKSTKASERSLSPRAEAQGEERPASQMSARSVKSTNGSVKSSKSRKSHCEGNETEASLSSKVEEEPEETQGEMVEEETQHEPDRASARSTMSHRSKMSNKNTGDANERTASVLSGKSALSEKSHHSKTDVDRSPSAASGKSRKSKCSAASPHGDEQPTETEERVASAMSVKSKSSARSNLQSASPGPNAVTINSAEEVEEEGKETTERAPSAASAKSEKSHVSSNHSGRKAPAAPRSRQSSARQLVPGSGLGEMRGSSALSVSSATSAKSGRSKCRCGAASGEDQKEGNDEEASEQAASVLSSSSKRQRRDSGGTEQPLSRCSSGSVSLGLPEDQEAADSDSGKSSFSFCTNTESKGRVKTAASEGPKTQRGSAVKKDVDIPTIKTPGGGDGRDEEDGGEQNAERAASAISTKSGRSQKSSPSRSAKVTENNLQTESESKTINLSANNNRTSSSMSSSSAKVRNKSPASANAAKTPVGDSSSNDAGNISEVKGQEDVAASAHSKSPCCLRPESAASAQSGSKTKVRSVKGRESRSKAGSNGGDVETLVKSSDPCALPDSRPGSKVESETTLSHSVSAADLLKETMTACPDRPESKASKTSDRTGGEKSPKSQRKRNQKEKKPDLTPACLPNASPNEVVNDWLRSIPANSSMLALGDELEEGEQEAQEKPGEEEVAQVEESPEDDKVDEEEKVESEEKQNSDPAPGDETVASCPTGLESADSLARNLHPSVAVMKVLLSSSLGRCRSLPEVSPVYGRRLSTSARGLLDSLAQLQLIEPALSPGRDLQKNPNHQYDEIMTILQSLWLTGPSDTEFKKGKDIGKEQVTPPRSSSGVGMSSGSGGSGKENGNKDGHETPPKEIESLPEVQVPSEDQSTLPQSLDSPKATENPSSSDKSSANDSSKSPTDNEQEPLDDTSSGTPSTVLRAPLSEKLSQDPDPVWVLHLLKKLEKQFINHYINAMAEFKVRWDLDDSLILDTMMSELKEEVSRRIQSSIEREIRKIKGRAGRGGRSPRPPQGAHLSRESTVTEKRRRILKVMKNQSVKTTDSVSDGEMEGDFSDQRSDDEYCPCDACVRKKMDARPLVVNPLAANAPVAMEFDLLKILQLKKSPEPAPVAVHQSAELEGEEGRNLEVVQEEEEEEEEETKEDIKAVFVLEDMIPEEDEEEAEGQTEDEEKVEKEENSEDGKEQEEGVKEGEETGEEGAQGNGEEEEGEGQTEEEEKVEREENSEDGKEQEEVEKEGEETGEEGAQGNEEEEEEGEAECQCECDRNEEESDKAEEEEEAEETGDNTGEDEVEDDEDETGTGEEESDLETVKEAAVGKGETTEGQEEEEEEEECEASDSKPVEEETTEKESGEEEAEDEEDGEDGGGEEESHEEGEGGESEEQEGPPPQDQGLTEGEEADAEDSDTDKKSPSDTSADEVVAGTTGDEEEKEAGGGDAVEEFKPEEEEEEEVNSSRKEEGALLHQFTRTSVESQPGSLEDIHTDSAPVSTIEVPKMGSTGGGASPKRSRSPGRVKCRKPKDRDMDLDDY
ncbi:retinitis pigmentosa 1-like 1 protein [Platichthys flesus]|uniref:retinitis pigmentosa 1-like 1 protein n=1 Tax=Platichthys flesus TaxID=8260 RepID=UPI002DB660F3|nr:retinitis pigmentosa 1-like 1 protein [Platichthys flesus]